MGEVFLFFKYQLPDGSGAVISNTKIEQILREAGASSPSKITRVHRGAIITLHNDHEINYILQEAKHHLEQYGLNPVLAHSTKPHREITISDAPQYVLEEPLQVLFEDMEKQNEIDLIILERSNTYLKATLGSRNSKETILRKGKVKLFNSYLKVSEVHSNRKYHSKPPLLPRPAPTDNNSSNSNGSINRDTHNNNSSSSRNSNNHREDSITRDNRNSSSSSNNNHRYSSSSNGSSKDSSSSNRSNKLSNNNHSSDIKSKITSNNNNTNNNNNNNDSSNSYSSISSSNNPDSGGNISSYKTNNSDSNNKYNNSSNSNSVPPGKHRHPPPEPGRGRPDQQKTTDQSGPPAPQDGERPSGAPPAGHMAQQQKERIGHKRSPSDGSDGHVKAIRELADQLSNGDPNLFIDIYNSLLSNNGYKTIFVPNFILDAAYKMSDRNNMPVSNNMPDIHITNTFDRNNMNDINNTNLLGKNNMPDSNKTNILDRKNMNNGHSTNKSNSNSNSMTDRNNMNGRKNSDHLPSTAQSTTPLIPSPDLHPPMATEVPSTNHSQSPHLYSSSFVSTEKAKAVPISPVSQSPPQSQTEPRTSKALVDLTTPKLLPSANKNSFILNAAPLSPIILNPPIESQAIPETNFADLIAWVDKEYQTVPSCKTPYSNVANAQALTTTSPSTPTWFDRPTLQTVPVCRAPSSNVMTPPVITTTAPSTIVHTTLNPTTTTQGSLTHNTDTTQVVNKPICTTATHILPVTHNTDPRPANPQQSMAAAPVNERSNNENTRPLSPLSGPINLTQANFTPNTSPPNSPTIYQSMDSFTDNFQSSMASQYTQNNVTIMMSNTNNAMYLTHHTPPMQSPSHAYSHLPNMCASPPRYTPIPIYSPQLTPTRPSPFHNILTTQLPPHPISRPASPLLNSSPAALQLTPAPQITQSRICTRAQTKNLAA